MKIAILTDVHGNLPALQVALRAIRREGADAIFHTGDAIGIGPFPAECLELLLSTPRHESDFAVIMTPMVFDRASRTTTTVDERRRVETSAVGTFLP